MGRRRIHTYLLYIAYIYIILYYIILYYNMGSGKNGASWDPETRAATFFFTLPFKFDLCSNMMQNSFTSNNDPHPQ